MSKDKTIKVRITTNPWSGREVDAEIDANQSGGIYVDGDVLGVIEKKLWFSPNEYKLISEGSNDQMPPEHHQTIEQLIAQMDTQADMAKRHTMEQVRLRDLIAARLNPLGYYLTKK